MFYARKELSAPPRSTGRPDIVERYRSGSRDFDEPQHNASGTGSRTAGPLRPEHGGRYSLQRATCYFVSSRARTCRISSSRSRPVRCAPLRQQVVLRGDNAADNPVAERLHLLARAAVADLPAPFPVGRACAEAASFRPRNGGWDSASIAVGDPHGPLRAPPSRRTEPRCWPCGRDSSGTLIMRLCHIRARGSSRSRSLAAFSTRSRSAMDYAGRVVASLDTTRHFVAPETGMTSAW